MTEIRDARCEDAGFLAQVILLAHRSHMPRSMWEIVLGDDEARVLGFLEALCTSPLRHWAHYSMFLVAEVEGQPAAALAGYFCDELGDAALDQAVEANFDRCGIDREEIGTGQARAAAVLNLFMAHPEHAWVIENLATLPEWRGRGLGEALIQTVLERGRHWGATVSDAGIFIGNHTGQRLFERCGFKRADEQRDPDFEANYACPGARMLRQSL